MFDKLRKKTEFSATMRKFGIFEAYANHTFNFDGSTLETPLFLLVPKAGGRYDTGPSILCDLIGVFRTKLSLKVTFRDEAECNLNYRLIWRDGMWYV